MKLFSLFILGLACALASCQKNAETPAQLQGSYKGSLRSAPGGDATYLLSSNVQVTINGNLYQSTSGSPASSRGSFKISNHQLIFTDSLAHTANFNWSELLDGTFNQSTKGDSLVWTKTLGSISYVYTLKKQ